MQENELQEKVNKLQAFKDYVHQRLDEAGIEKEPSGEHSKAGCRIGDRLDLVLCNQHSPDTDKKGMDLNQIAFDAVKGFKPVTDHPMEARIRAEMFKEGYKAAMGNYESQPETQEEVKS